MYPMFNLTLICYRETKIIFLRLKLAFAKINYGNFAFLLWPQLSWKSSEYKMIIQN